jgi:hypothetical protein
MIVTAIRPPNSPVRMDSIGKPGTPHVPPDAGVMPVPVVVVVLLVIVDTMVVNEVEVVYDVVVPGTLSGP